MSFVSANSIIAGIWAIVGEHSSEGISVEDLLNWCVDEALLYCVHSIHFWPLLRYIHGNQCAGLRNVVHVEHYANKAGANVDKT